jgi:hypothetical protein
MRLFPLVNTPLHAHSTLGSEGFMCPMCNLPRWSIIPLIFKPLPPIYSPLPPSLVLRSITSWNKSLVFSLSVSQAQPYSLQNNRTLRLQSCTLFFFRPIVRKCSKVSGKVSRRPRARNGLFLVQVSEKVRKTDHCCPKMSNSSKFKDAGGMYLNRF